MKSATDLHWNNRAATVPDDIDVNTMDVFQREAELECLYRYLTPNWRLLEVGCGNGYSTARFRDRVAHVDAFDFSEAMILRARETYGERNNRFFRDSVLDPEHLEPSYDAVVCVRVLINLRSVGEQTQALRTIAGVVRKGGRVLLLEGFSDGFEGLSVLRSKVGLDPVQPASINLYTSLAELQPEIERLFEIRDTFHLGAYDYLTRVVYPLVVKPENPRHNTVFSERAAELTQAFNPPAFQEISRLRGFVLEPRA
jgi:SAM-dependent methyltransferase